MRSARVRRAAYFGADAALRAADVAAFAASSADEADDDGAGDMPVASEAGAEGVAGVVVTEGTVGVITTGAGVTTAGAGSSFLPQAVSAAAAIKAASRTDLFMESPLS